MSRALAPLAALAACLAAGCSTTSTTIDIGDHRAFVPSARLSIGPASDTPSEPKPGSAFELGVSRASGGSTQSLSAGQQVQLAEQSYNGPRMMTNEIDATLLDAAARLRSFDATQRVGFELLLGFGYADLNVSVSSGARRNSDHYNSLGVLFGVGVIARLRPGTSAQARLSLFRAADLTEETEVNRLDLAVVQALGRNAALRAGWAFWAIDATRSGHSDVSARLSGPALGLDISF
jgi:hypothetical protein